MVKNFFFFLFLFLSFSFLVFAQSQQIYTLPEVPVGTILKRLADILFFILVALALIFVIWGGISFATAGGDPSRIETAKRMIVFALVGIVIGAMAFGLTNLVVSYLSDGGMGSSGGRSSGGGTAPLPPEPPQALCGNGICERGESGMNCPEDCCRSGDGICQPECSLIDSDCGPTI